MLATPEQILEFWAEAGSKAWFRKDLAFDSAINERFRETYDAAVAGKLDSWCDTASGMLALVIILDQFSRNLFRNDARAFAQDEKCAALARAAIAKDFDQAMPADLVSFCYMPLMHSENISDQKLSLEKMGTLEGKDWAKHAKEHLEIVERFGRFPHRNKVLGRKTSPQEQAFLDAGGFRG